MTIDELRALCLSLSREIIESAWRRTAPRAIVKALEEAKR